MRINSTISSGSLDIKLDSLVEMYGSQNAAFQAIHSGVQREVSRQGISGVFRDLPVVVGSQKILVRGNVVDGAVKIGTAFRP